MNGKLQTIAIKAITPTKHNPRAIRANDPAVAELAKSIEAHGLLQPVICRATGKDKYELLAGRRRYEAHKLLKFTDILCIVSELTDQEAKEVTVLENLQRENLSPIEEARGVACLLGAGESAVQVAAKIGKTPQWVIRRAKLSEISDELLQKIEKECDGSNTSVQHLEMIAAFSPEQQEQIVEHTSQWLFEPGNFRQFKDNCSRFLRKIKGAAFSADNETLVPEAGSCTKCQKRSSVHPGLFTDELDATKIASDDTCTDGECFDRKLAAHLAIIEAEKRNEHPGMILVATDKNSYSLADEEAKRGVLGKNEFSKVKKGDKKAKPALVTHGPGAGKIIYVQVTGTASHAAKAAKKSEQSPAENMAVKREMLANRRKAWVVEHVKESLKGSAFPILGDNKLLVIVAMAATFGTSENKSSPTPTDWDESCVLTRNAKDAIDQLWNQIRNVLARRLVIYQTQSCQSQYDDALRIADLIGLVGEKELLKMAADAIPEPKAWTKQ